jgi:hypothetical protein
MSQSQLLLSHLNHPGIICFFMGILARSVKSDLKIPPDLREGMSLFLLFAIGLKGGFALRETSLSMLLGPFFLTLFFGCITPIVAYFLLKRIGRFRVVDAAALAAHFGSVSIVTFMASISFAEKANINYESFWNVLVVVLEIPGILVALFIGSRFSLGSDFRWLKILHKTLSGSTPFLMGTGILLGLIGDPNDLKVLSRVFISPFQGVLVFFLLEMGLTTASHLRQAKASLGKLFVFGTFLPIFFGMSALLCAYFFGFSKGGCAVFATMIASSSYIAAPATVRIALPTANPALYLTSSIGITLPFNIMLGIPLYFYVSTWLAKGH